MVAIRYDHLIYEKQEHRVTLVLNRAEKLNALNEKLTREFEQAMIAAEDDNDVRVVVLRGAGRGFCAGHDYSKENFKPGERERGHNTEMHRIDFEKRLRAYMRVWEIPKLTEALGQSVVVDNRSGANAVIGTDIAAKSPPDGYTIMIAIPTLTVTPGISGISVRGLVRCSGAGTHTVRDRFTAPFGALENHAQPGVPSTPHCRRWRSRGKYAGILRRLHQERDGAVGEDGHCPKTC